MDAQATKLHVARLLASVVACNRCVVYDIDRDLLAHGHIAHDGETRWTRRYADFLAVDPLRPELYARSVENVFVTGWNFATSRLLRSSYYEGFMRPIGQRHKAEMFFRNRTGRLIGGARLSRSDSFGTFSDGDISVIQLMQPVIESHISTLASSGANERSGPLAKLTRREWDVIQLAASGLSNKDICRKLGTALPTVKTQMASAFRKLTVGSRAELLTLLLSHGERS